MVLRLFLAPNDFGIWIFCQLDGDAAARERCDLLHSEKRHILNVLFAPRLQQIVIDLAAAHHHAADIFARRIGFIFADHAVEIAAGGKILQFGGAQLMAQQRFRRHHNQRLAVAAPHLAPEHMKVRRRRGAIDDLDIALRRQLQIALHAGRAMLRALALMAVRQQHYQARHSEPFAFAG